MGASSSSSASRRRTNQASTTVLADLRAHAARESNSNISRANALAERLAAQATMEAATRSTPATPPPQTHKTTTIRNHVNLKKSTLEIVSAEDAPHKIGVRFHVDADKAFRAAVALRAREDPKNGSSCEPVSANPIARSTISIPSVILDAGLGRVFEQDEATFVDARAFGGDELTTATTDGSRVYPMIIRLECIGDDYDYDEAGGDDDDDASGGEHGGSGGERDGAQSSSSPPPPRRRRRALADLPAHPSGGLAPLQRWAQSQTTYVELRRNAAADAPWAAHVLKQKIWVQGSSYELQEIYGIDACAAGAPASSSTDPSSSTADPSSTAAFAAADEGKECVICLCEPRDTTVLPCRHLCMCADCARQLRAQPSGNVCPICRNPCESLLEIKVVSTPAPRDDDDDDDANDTGIAPPPTSRRDPATRL